jgi:hypothetical protein
MQPVCFANYNIAAASTLHVMSVGDNVLQTHLHGNADSSGARFCFRSTYLGSGNRVIISHYFSHEQPLRMDPICNCALGIEFRMKCFSAATKIITQYKLSHKQNKR